MTPPSDLTPQQAAGLACYQQRVAARTARINAALACCPDCAAALRTDPLDRARYHVARAEAHAEEATRHAAEAARFALRARRANVIGVAILVPLSLVVLALAAVVLANG